MNRGGGVEVEAPPAEVQAEAAGPAEIAPENAQPPESFPTRLHSHLRGLIPEALAHRWRAFAAWSHTRAALVAGTCALGVAGVFAAGALVAIGVFGAGTPAAPGLYYAGGSAEQPGPSLPSDSSAIFGPLVSSPETRTVVGQALSAYVIQPADLPAGLTLQESGATGLDPTSGLLGSYHAVFEPAVIAAGAAPAGTTPQSGAPLVVFSAADAYEDVDSATSALDDNDVQQLGTEAGLPQLTSEAAVAPTVGDESRALYLHGNTGTTDIAVYVILFRNGPMVGVLGVAWPRGQESLSTAVGLAQAQNVRMVAARSGPPNTIVDPNSIP